jgi:hypothetical protein
MTLPYLPSTSVQSVNAEIPTASLELVKLKIDLGALPQKQASSPWYLQREPQLMFTKSTLKLTKVAQILFFPDTAEFSQWCSGPRRIHTP